LHGDNVNDGLEEEERDGAGMEAPSHFSSHICSSINLMVSFLLLDGMATLHSERKLRIFFTHGSSLLLGWCQDNGNRSNQESKFDFLATRQRLGKSDEGQQKIKIVRTNRQSNLRVSCQSIFSLCRHHPTLLLFM